MYMNRKGKMKKIAFLSFDWNNEVVSQYISGMERFMKDHDNVVLHLFDGFGNFGTYEVRKGSLQIFNLPYMENYDGIIIEGNRAWKPEDRQVIADRAIANGLPVVSINYPLKGCMNVSSDNEESEYAIVNHVIQEHGVRRIAFVRGLSTSLETEDRERGFLRAVKENDIDHYRILDGSWDQEAGVRAVDDLLKEGLMPEAIICSNDDAAYGAIEELKRHHYRIPENVIVTGFDNLNIAEASDPRITTVSRNYAGMAYAAMDLILVELESGIRKEEEMKVSGDLVKGTSCGCGNYRQEIQDVKQKYVQVNRKVKQFYRIHDDVENALDHTSDLPEIADILEKMAPALTKGDLWMVINGDYLDRYNNTPAVRHYGSRMYLYAIHDGEEHKHDENHIYETFSRKKVLPEKYQKKRKILEVYPLHYDEIAIGYVVMDSLMRKDELNFLGVLFPLLESAIEHVHNRYIQSSLNNRLSTLYTTDQQSGLYNRFGMEKFADPYYRKRMEQGRDTYVTFIDIDNMKIINDQYGHKSGDEAILLTSDAIRRALKGTEDIAVRYGGDEFVIFSGEDVRVKIVRALNSLIRERRVKWQCQLTIGVYVAEKKEGLSLQDAVNQADDAMYAIKKNRTVK